MRRGEALRLEWPDVDLQASRVSVQRSRTLAGGRVLEHPPKTERGRRSIPLDAVTVTALRAWKAWRAEERLAAGSACVEAGWVSAHEGGLPPHPGVITKRFADAGARTDLPRILLHDLRHTSAALALAAGEHPRVVQERLGHAAMAQTMDICSHTTPALHEAAAARPTALVDG